MVYEFKYFSESTILLTIWTFNKHNHIYISAPAYADDGANDTPRGFPGTSPVLPPANAVTQQLFQVEKKNTGNDMKLTTLFMTFGQFLDHDLTETPMAKCNVTS